MKHQKTAPKVRNANAASQALGVCVSSLVGTSLVQYTWRMGENSDWKWSYSYLWGVMYGPVPVGGIVVGIAALFYFASR